MLAVRLHKRKKLGLSKGCFLIPIMSWRTGKLQILNWVRTLNRQNKEGPNNAIRFITLVKIPDDHPIALYADWGIRCQHQGLGKVEIKPLRECSKELKQTIEHWHEYDYGIEQDGIGVFGAIPFYGGPLESPELILGKPLPKASVKWTKSIQLLYGKKTNNNRKFISNADIS